jgi:hypothetical protein
MKTNSQLLNHGFCCVCLNQIEANQYYFAGSVACEQCARKYYKDEGAPEEYITQELSWRERAAAMRKRKYPQSRIEQHQETCDGRTL